MFVVLGATGHVGSAVARTLLDRGEPVTVVTRRRDKARDWERRGARAAVLDVGDAGALRAALPPGGRLFALNPLADPTDPSLDPEAEEIRTGDAIAAAVEGAGLERVVAQSTYGAQPGDRIGDLGTLHHFEQVLAAQPTPVVFSRGAYFLSNWDGVVEQVRSEGRLRTMFDPRTPIPMVAPADLGLVAADLLTTPEPPTGERHVEGPRRYSPQDVADAFADALGRRVEVAVTPRSEWVSTFLGLGFSEAGAESYAGMTAAAADDDGAEPTEVTRGTTTLEEYVRALVEKRPPSDHDTRL